MHCGSPDPMEVAVARDHLYPDINGELVWSDPRIKRVILRAMECKVGYSKNCPQCR